MSELAREHEVALNTNCVGCSIFVCVSIYICKRKLVDLVSTKMEYTLATVIICISTNMFDYYFGAHA